MGSAGAEAGDGVRQEGEGRRGGRQLLVLPAGTRHSSLQLRGKEEVSWIICQSTATEGDAWFFWLFGVKHALLPTCYRTDLFIRYQCRMKL